MSWKRKLTSIALNFLLVICIIIKEVVHSIRWSLENDGGNTIYDGSTKIYHQIELYLSFTVIFLSIITGICTINWLVKDFWSLKKPAMQKKIQVGYAIGIGVLYLCLMFIGIGCYFYIGMGMISACFSDFWPYLAFLATIILGATYFSTPEKSA